MAYELTHKCFVSFYIANLILWLVANMAGVMCDSKPLTIFSIVMAVEMLVTIIAFCAVSINKSILNPAFAKSTSGVGFLAICIFWLVYGVINISNAINNPTFPCRLLSAISVLVMDCTFIAIYVLSKIAVKRANEMADADEE